MDTNLCKNCRFLDYAEFGNNKTRVYCSKLYRELKSYAIKCRLYQPKDQPSLSDFYNSAWILTKTTKAGFVTPEFEFEKPKERYVPESEIDKNR